MSDTEAAEDDFSRLCLSCGLCCNGALFDRAKAQPEELERMAGHGLSLFADGKGDKFRLPFPKLEGTACTIYSKRFVICRSFECKLLARVKDGSIGVDRALGLVGEAKALLADLSTGKSDLAMLEGRQEELRRGPPTGDAQRGRIFVAILALDRFLDRHFRKKPLQRGFETLDSR